jgi:hypothetical protein
MHARLPQANASVTAAFPLPSRTRASRLQRSAISAEPANVPPVVHDVLRSPGQPLDGATRDFMEPRFGHDFSRVRIHADSRAAASAQSVNALAYTVGRDVVFGAAQYQPGTQAGRHLLAHELAHVVQQRSTGTHGSLHFPSGRANALIERDAVEASRQLARGQRVQPARQVAPGTLARQTESPEEPGVLGTIAGGLMGEFNEDPTFAMIGVDTVVSLIPIADQVSDVRDIVAHIYYLTVRRQYDRVMRWVGLVLTLIGLIPELGSAIKSASKFIIKGVREVLGRLGEFLAVIRRILPEMGDVSRFQRYVAEHWASWVAAGNQIFRQVLDQVSSVVNSGSFIVRATVGRIRESLAHVRDIAPARLRDAYGWVRQQIDDVLTQVRERLGRNAEPDQPTGVPQDIDADVEKAFDEMATEPVAPLGPLTPTPASTNTIPPSATGGTGIVESGGASTIPSGTRTGSAQTPRSVRTAILADIGEAEAYKAALSRGEIGLQRPAGSNVPGVDFITARRDSNGQMWILLNDAKTSQVGRFPSPASSPPASWVSEAQQAVTPSRLNLGNAALEAEIRTAVAQGRIRLRQLNVNYSPAGQGAITGF